ncbi:hypothetical protein PGT21_014876 [Puccinia graminis f. sp. tritici]|uniref:Uncharacterized protein n=1 Tax=Puccinia graminis f. sp. tritici TaxID=56615 RepID=A0A5B0QFD0_PUCGR|nr:hypothetical protein PGT21_014876 [Puccinia graminis f. sp. tritici]
MVDCDQLLIATDLFGFQSTRSISRPAYPADGLSLSSAVVPDPFSMKYKVIVSDTVFVERVQIKALNTRNSSDGPSSNGI